MIRITYSRTNDAEAPSMADDTSANYSRTNGRYTAATYSIIDDSNSTLASSESYSADSNSTYSSDDIGTARS